MQSLFRHPMVLNPRGILSIKQDSLLRCANKFRSILQLSQVGEQDTRIVYTTNTAGAMNSVWNVEAQSA